MKEEKESMRSTLDSILAKVTIIGGVGHDDDDEKTSKKSIPAKVIIINGVMIVATMVMMMMTRRQAKTKTKCHCLAGRQISNFHMS